MISRNWFPTLQHKRTEIQRWRRQYSEERPKNAIVGTSAPHLANTDIINPEL